MQLIMQSQSISLGIIIFCCIAHHSQTQWLKTINIYNFRIVPKSNRGVQTPMQSIFHSSADTHLPKEVTWPSPGSKDEVIYSMSGWEKLQNHIAKKNVHTEGKEVPEAIFVIHSFFSITMEIYKEKIFLIVNKSGRHHLKQVIKIKITNNGIR